MPPPDSHLRSKVFRTSGSSHLRCVCRWVVDGSVLNNPLSDQKDPEEAYHNDDREDLSLEYVEQQGVSAVQTSRVSLGVINT
jgi:hypothetical protein